MGEEVAAILLDINSDTLELPVEGLARLGLTVPMMAAHPEIPAFPACMALYLMATSRFTLWWD